MKLGISCGTIVKRYGYERALELCCESGFNAVDYSLECYGVREDPSDIYNAPESEFVAHFTAIREKAAACGLEISQTHGRCRTYTPDEAQCAYARWVCEKDLQATSILGAPACVIHHPASGSWPDNYLEGDFMHRKALELYAHLIPIAERYGVSVAVETFGRAMVRGVSTVDYFGDVNRLKTLYDALDTENKLICFDTGHTHEAAPFGVPDVSEAIRILGGDIKLLHLHDNNSSADQHLPPLTSGRGVIDWPEVFDALEDIGYDGVYNFELYLTRYGEMLPDAIRFLGKFLRYFIENKGRIN